MATRTREQIEARFRPEALQAGLVTASLYLTAYELLRSAIVDDTKGFFHDDYVNGKWIVSPEYAAGVTRLDDDVFKASCLFLQGMGVLTTEDIEDLGRLRAERNRIAHELPSILITPKESIDVELFVRVHHYLGLVGRFWARTGLEAEGYPALDQVKDEDIIPGRLAVLMIIMKALGLSS